MRFGKRDIGCMIFVMLSTLGFTQSPKAFQYTTEDGLPSNEIHDAEFDMMSFIFQDVYTNLLE